MATAGVEIFSLIIYSGVQGTHRFVYCVLSYSVKPRRLHSNFVVLFCFSERLFFFYFQLLLAQVKCFFFYCKRFIVMTIEFSVNMRRKLLMQSPILNSLHLNTSIDYANALAILNIEANSRFTLKCVASIH